MYLDQWSSPFTQCLLYLNTIVPVVGHLEPDQPEMPDDRQLNTMNAISIGRKIIECGVITFCSCTSVNLGKSYNDIHENQ